MTEEAWLRSGDSGQLLHYIMKQRHLQGNLRRLSLFALASALRCWEDDPAIADRVMEIAERLANGQEVDQAELNSLARHGDARGDGMGSKLYDAILVSRHKLKWPVEELAKHIAWSFARARGRGEMAVQCRLLRDVFGNPFRPITFDPNWRTTTAVAIARGMYESRDFSAMPILADALQDAGCENDDVLNHCREANATHVRGCWVVDLVLGK